MKLHRHMNLHPGLYLRYKSLQEDTSGKSCLGGLLEAWKIVCSGIKQPYGRRIVVRLAGGCTTFH